jgi:hypothetical protein
MGEFSLFWEEIKTAVSPLTRQLVELCISPDQPDLLHDIGGVIRSWKPPAFMVDYDPETEDLWTGHLVNNWWAEGEVRCQEGGCEEMMALLPVLLNLGLQRARMVTRKHLVSDEQVIADSRADLNLKADGSPLRMSWTLKGLGSVSRISRIS